MTRDDVLAALPPRGWGTVRDVPPLLMLGLHAAGYVKAQYTPTPGTYQARLTALGRARLSERTTP